MPPEFKDYYAVLGVAPDATDQVIKDAYRKLARQHHPDVNPGNKASEEKFKEINEAYQALNDPERRKKYDVLRQQYQQFQQQGGTRGFNWSNWQAEPVAQTYTRTVTPEDMEDLFGEAEPFSDFFSSIFGSAASERRGNRPRRGRDIEVPVELSLEEAFRGTTLSLKVGDRQVEARIPPGIRNGSRVRLAGQGSPGAAGGSAGDIYLVATIRPHPQFERDGDDLHTTIAVDVYTAASGGQVRVPALDGAVTLKIPPRTQADRVFRLKGKGMPRLEKPTERGDLFAKVKLVLPEPLSDQELNTLRSLAEARQTRERQR